MSILKPDENLLNNYIQNKLTETEIEQLELWLADHPDVMEELELEVMIKQAGNSSNQKSNVNKSKPQSFSFFDFFTSRQLIPVHILAYGMMAFLVFNTINNPKQNQQSSVATFIELEKQRGTEAQVIEVQINDKQSLVLRFFPDSMTDKYSLVMQSTTVDEKFEFEELVADDYGSITVSINNTANIIGDWEIILIDSTNKREQKSLLLIN